MTFCEKSKAFSQRTEFLERTFRVLNPVRICVKFFLLYALILKVFAKAKLNQGLLFSFNPLIMFSSSSLRVEFNFETHCVYLIRSFVFRLNRDKLSVIN